MTPCRSRVFLSALALFGGLPPASAESPPGAYRTPSSWSEYKTEHYTLRTSAKREQARELADFMELVHKTYSALLIKGAPPKPPKHGNIILLFANREAFLKAGMPPSVGALYRPSTGELIGYYHPVTMKPFFAHEGMHQFTDLTLPNFKEMAVPMWFTEGIADCIGNSVEREGRLYMCSLSGVIASMRLPTVHQAIRENQHVPLAKLLAMDREAFYADAGLCYAEAWSFCHFLMAHPKKEDPLRQIPDGTYRKVISIFYEGLLDRKADPEAAWALALRAGRIASIEDLEEEWKAYVLDLGRPDPDGPFLGVSSDAKRYAEGVVIGRVVPGSPAARGGLQAGDLVVRFSGKPVELWNDFVSFLSARKPGDKVVLTVKRDGKTVEVPVTLEKRGDGR